MTEPAGHASDWIDAVIHAPARLQIMMQLFVLDGADATFLLNRTGLTWGNLSTHISKLEEAAYVTVDKTFQGRKPRTMIRLTAKGRRAFQDYREKMQHALADPADV